MHKHSHLPSAKHEPSDLITILVPTYAKSVGVKSQTLPCKLTQIGPTEPLRRDTQTGCKLTQIGPTEPLRRDTQTGCKLTQIGQTEPSAKRHSKSLRLRVHLPRRDRHSRRPSTCMTSTSTSGHRRPQRPSTLYTTSTRASGSPHRGSARSPPTGRRGARRLGRHEASKYQYPPRGPRPSTNPRRGPARTRWSRTESVPGPPNKPMGPETMFLRGVLI